MKMKAKVTVVYTHNLNGTRQQDTIDIELEADRKAYGLGAFEGILKQRGVVNPLIESIGPLTVSVIESDGTVKATNEFPFGICGGNKKEEP